MGASNVAAAFAYWPHLDNAPFRALCFMANLSLDEWHKGQPPRRYFAGPEELASALGYPAPPDANALRAVRRALHKLTDAGAVETIVSAAPGRRAEYALHLDGGRSASAVPEGNGGRSVTGTEDAQWHNGGRSVSTTEDAQRPPQEPLRNHSGTREDQWGLPDGPSPRARTRESDEQDRFGSEERDGSRARASVCERCGLYLEPDGTCRDCRRGAA